MDEPIRPISIAEHAILAAERAAATGEPALNPFDESDKPGEHRKWNVCFKRAQQMRDQCDTCEGGA